MQIQNRFDYSMSAQQDRNTGAIPEGTYWKQPEELWQNRWWSPRSRSSWGNYALSIHPFHSTVTFGRGGFFIHGGDQLGSKGCIDLALSMDRFVQDLMEAISFQPKCSILLRVKYDK